MKHCLLPPLLTALRGALRLCQHFLLPGTYPSFPPASIFAVSLLMLQPPWLHPSSTSNARRRQPACLPALPTHLGETPRSAAWPTRPLLADPLSPSTHLSASGSDVRCSPGPLSPLTYGCPVPMLSSSPGSTFPSLSTKFHHPTAGSFFCFPGSGDEKADESALLWIHVNSPFPQRSPRTASAHLLLHCPAASPPAPAPPALKAGPRPPSRSPKRSENVLKKKGKVA